MSGKTANYDYLSIHKIYHYALYAILLLAIMLGFLGLNKGLWNDEISTVLKISHQNIFAMFEHLKQNVHPPLYYVLLYCWGKISKQEEFLRLFSLLLNLGTLLVPSEKQITVRQLDKISNLDLSTKELNMFFINLTGNVKDYSNLLVNILKILKSKNLTTLKIHLFLIKGHDSYFSKKFDNSEKFIVISESKLGKPYLYQDFGLYVMSKYMVVLN